MKQYLLRQKSLIWATYKSVLMLFVAMVFLVLFLLWYPDFISWFSGKLPNAGFLNIIPAIVFVLGLSYGIFLLYLSISYWREMEIKNGK